MKKNYFIATGLFLVMALAVSVFAYVQSDYFQSGSTVMNESGFYGENAEITNVNITNGLNTSYINTIDEFDVRSFGAIPDNSGFDSANAINDAISAACANNGGVVKLSNGRYYINSSINLWCGGVKLQGYTAGYNDYGSEIVLMDNADTTMINVYNGTSSNIYFPTIRDITLHGNRGNQNCITNSCHGIRIYGVVFDMFIEDVLVFDTEDFGFQIDSGKNYLHNVYAEYCNKGVNITGGSLTYIDTLYSIFSYEKGIHISGSPNHVIITNSYLGYGRGAENTIKMTHSSGSVMLNNLYLGGGKPGYTNQTAIINLSMTGVGYANVRDVRIYSGDTKTEYMFYKGENTNNNQYDIQGVYDSSPNDFWNIDNGVQWQEKIEQGTFYRNQNLSISDSINVNKVNVSNKIELGSDIITKTNTRLAMVQGNGFDQTKHTSQGIELSSYLVPSIYFQSDSTTRAEISWYRGSRSYPEFSIREHTTSDRGGEIYAGDGLSAPILTLEIKKGYIVNYPNSSITYCNDIVCGAIYYNNITKKHYGCNCSDWNELY